MGTATRPHSRPRPRRRLRPVAVAVISVVLMALTGCGGDGGDASLKAAQVAVTSKEKALTEAEDVATKASAEFCATSATYVKALDRYGDVLNGTAPTVGDVRMAGSDLAKPAEEAKSAAQAVADSRAAVATAEQELAQAQATLATAQASAAGTPPPSPSPTKTPSPTPTPASVTRVQEAESEFATAQVGITDQTPLAEATEQFNAAAVAVEMAWLQLIGDSGCLSDAQQEKAAEAIETYTTTLQKALAEAGYYEAEFDGIYGPKTVAAVEALQKANGLPQTGTLDKATEKALRTELAAKGGEAAKEETASTAAVQQTLKLAGYWDGPVDGVWTDALTSALEALQEDLGVKVTGTVDAATVAALEEAIADAGQPASPTRSPDTGQLSSPSRSPSPTAGSPAATASS
jgi:peptidoglycan hydrolase-like protein with peptidoglycan-binding domain